MKKRLLIVYPDVPYPPNRNGMSIRYYPLIRRLAVDHEVTLICRWSEEEEPDLGDLGDWVEELHVLRLEPKSKSLRNRIGGAMSRISPFGTPYKAYDYNAELTANWIVECLKGRYDSVLCAGLSQRLRMIRWKIDTARFVLDIVDSPSLMMERRPDSPAFKKDLRVRKIKRWEAALINLADAAVYISPVDQRQVEHRIDPRVELDFIPNGVFVDDHTEEAVDLPSPSVGILGNMSYPPNIEMALSLHQMWNQLRATTHPNLHLCIIGRLPHPSVAALAGPGVTVTGAVPNIWSWVNAVDLFVVDMKQGAGLQNKLLEIMYAGRPIVASPEANGGLGAIEGESIELARNETEFLEKMTALLDDPDRRSRIGAGGRRFVEAEYLWDSVYRKFDRFIRGAQET
ncbi:MAG: glycosyltransferase [Myxococcota bacterium]|nr:glycosyltransferase [Myxococcota bacterium]